LVVSLEVSNTRRRSAIWAVTVRDEIRRDGAEPTEQALEPESLVPYVAPGKSCAVVYRGRLTQRGRYRFGPIRLATGFPFGLFWREAACESPATLYVYPRLGRLGRRWVIRHREAFEGSQRRERRAGQLSGDFFGVRAWQRGDSRRWIHWRSTARRGNLVVRQFERYRNRDVAVLVDLWQPARPDQEHLDNVELAVSFAATVVTDLCRRGGGEVLLGLAGATLQWAEGPASTAILDDAMQRLALARPTDEDRLPSLLSDALERIGPDVQVVLVSTRDVDLGDAARFSRLSGTPAWRTLRGRVRSINVASKELEEYFQVE
jgi:uncharacterized protein (DUF58 family)